MKSLILALLNRIEYAPVISFVLFFKPADLWIGAYIDTANRAIYICPVPMLGVKITWRMEDV